MVKPPSPIPLTWLLNQDAWVEQWPIIEPKLSILKKIAAEQLKMAYIEPATSNHNTPIFVIPKISGCYYLLHNLHSINDQMEKMGYTQSGLPHPSSIPPSYYISVLDIKDCFFSNPLVPQDQDDFAFTVCISQPKEINVLFSRME